MMDWKVSKVERSERNGEFFLTGVNLNTGDDFYIHVGRKTLVDNAHRYDLSEAEVAVALPHGCAWL